MPGPAEDERFTVKVRYFAAHREAAGVAEEDVNLARGSTVADLLNALQALHPGLAPLARDTVVSVNRGVGGPSVVLSEGDDVALFPPIAGG